MRYEEIFSSVLYKFGHIEKRSNDEEKVLVNQQPAKELR